MKWYKQLHWQILIAMGLGILYGILASSFNWVEFTRFWIKPWGTIFITLLKMIAIPMIFFSLVCGVASLNDLKKMSRIGGKTIGLYLITTVIAIVIGLVLVTSLKPGKYLSPDMRQRLEASYNANLDQAVKDAETTKSASPLQVIVDIVPHNVIDAASDNINMLQVVFVAVLIGIGLVKTNKSKTNVVQQFFEGMNEVVLAIVQIIMLIAPLGVFAQLSSVVTELAGTNPLQALDVLKTLGFYVIVVLLGLLAHTLGTYGSMLKFMSRVGVGRFFAAIRPAQLIGFSTSSSAATLPVNMKCCEENLGVSEEITSFTLPVGATVNMDGTSIYQAVSAIFIAQILGMDLTLADQLTLILTATLASIGTAGVPGSGIVMLVIVMQSVHIPIESIALIIGVERIIDMFRTVVNITGDAVVTTIVAQSEGKLNPPWEKEPEELQATA